MPCLFRLFLRVPICFFLSSTKFLILLTHSVHISFGTRKPTLSLSVRSTLPGISFDIEHDIRQVLFTSQHVDSFIVLGVYDNITDGC